MATSCWNRGCHHAKFERTAEAQRFLRQALHMAPFCPELTAARQVKTLVELGFGV